MSLQSNNHRILQLSPHLTSSNKTVFSKYDKYSSNPDYNISFRSLLFGKYHIEYFKILDKIASERDFISFSENPTKKASFLLMRKFARLIGINYHDFIQDSRKYHSLIDALYSFDNATGLRIGVDFDLYLRSLLSFGTNKHLIFIKKLFNLTDFGCFALSELAHGSNNKDIITTAQYKQDSDEFIINSNSELGYKFWIGSAKEISNMSIIFSNLIINDQNYGVQAFVVPIRNKHNHSLLPGIYIGDCGKKMGLNAKDEGIMIFKNVRIPRDNMLDRYSKVTNKGEFISNMKTLGERFGFLIGTILNEPRILVSNRTLINLINGLTITARFVCFRRQFHKPGAQNDKELQIIEYPLTQYRLFPILAGCIVLKVASKGLYDLYEELKSLMFDMNNPKIMELHALISIIKPITTWFSRNGLMNCREICGGLGFSALNRLGSLYNDNNVNVIWEGDNYVLIQQTARYLLDTARSIKIFYDFYINYEKSHHNKNLSKNLLDFLKTEEEIDFKSKNTILKDKKDLVNLSIIEKIFEHRLAYLIKKSSNELNKNIDEFPDVFSAWNNSQIYFLKNMAIAYGELFILKVNIKEINNSNYNKDMVKTLKILVCLWSLNTIYENIGDFLNYFTKENLNDIKDLILELCTEIKDKVVSIVDSICVPEQVLNSPIGMKSEEIYTAFLRKVMQQKANI